MANWGFLTNHARVLLCIAHDPGTRLRDIAARLGITERSAHGIITDLTAAGYLVKQKDGRRNRYQIQGGVGGGGGGGVEGTGRVARRAERRGGERRQSARGSSGDASWGREMKAASARRD